MLTGRKALVTGGSRGIGFAIAKAFADSGAQVIITGREEDSLRAACDAIGSDRIGYIVWDLEDFSCYDERLQTVITRLGTLDTLVNNAGLNFCAQVKEQFFDETYEIFDRTMAVNVKAPYFLTQKVMDYMRRNTVHGNILNISSEMGFRPAKNIYCTSKWSAVGMTEGLALIGCQYGIVVNGIAPGPTTTVMMGFKEGDKNEHPEIPNGRWATPEEIGALAVYMVSDIARNLVGETIICDGGHHLH